jgi:hypothetical protein
MGFFRSLGRIAGKVLKVGGNVARTIGNIGGKAVDFAKNNAGMIGAVAGTGLTMLGMPEFGLPIAAAGNAIQKFAGDKTTQNVMQGIKAVGKLT